MHDAPGRVNHQIRALAAVTSTVLFGFRRRGERSGDPGASLPGFFRFRGRVRLPNALAGQPGSRSVRLRSETIGFPRSTPELRCEGGCSRAAISYEALSSATDPDGRRRGTPDIIDPCIRSTSFTPSPENPPQLERDLPGPDRPQTPRRDAGATGIPIKHSSFLSRTRVL
jgi:hypothetical protein